MAIHVLLWSAILVLSLSFSAAQGALLRPPSSPGRRLAAGAYFVLVLLPTSAFVFSYLPWPWPFRTVALTLAGYLVWIWSRPNPGSAARTRERRVARRALMASMSAVGVWAAASLLTAPDLSPALVGIASVAAAAACLIPTKPSVSSVPSAEVQ
ncbi:MAG: hypothetical protein WD906_02580 [Anaerolineales bacterium]